MEAKLPYYMVYPTPLLFDDMKKEEWDYDYLKSMYPKLARQILPYVEDECQRMEYDGSMIYDEYPDKLQLRLMCSRVQHQVIEQEELEEEQMVREIVELLVYQELWKRRCMHRRKYNRKYW